MPIPQNITPKNIQRAITKIEADGIPGHRKSLKYFLRFKNRLYPPKYVISVANYYANGEMLSADAKVFNTYQAQNYLESLEFEVIVKQQRKCKA